MVAVPQVNDGAVKPLGAEVVPLEFQDLRNEASAGAPFQVHQHIQGIADICLDGAKANVRPATTIATRDSPRAMVLVKARCRTLTAFSQGELPVAV